MTPARALAGPAAVFDRAADTYDAVGVPWFGPIAQSLVTALAPQPGERALDLGCGSGAALLPLALAVGSTGSALGIDLAPRMVARAAAAAARAAGDGPPAAAVEVRVGDAAAPELPAASYDVVAASLVLFFLPDPAAAVGRWAQLLASGGRLGVTTFGEQDRRWQRVDALFAPHLPPGLRDARTSGRSGPFASDAGVEELLRGAGLEEVATVGSTVDAVFHDAEHLVAFTWSTGQRAMWEAVPAPGRAALEREVVELARTFQEPSGTIRFSQRVRCTLGRRA